MAAKGTVAVVIAVIAGVGWFGGVLVGIAAGLLVWVVLSLPALVGRARKRWGASTQKDTRQTDAVPWGRYFDRLFHFEINQMYFRGLWKDDVSLGPQPNAEPFVMFEIVVYNNTPLALYITGCDGRASVDGDICTISARLEPEGRQEVAPWAYQILKIKQHLLSEKGRELLQKAETEQVIRFALSSIRIFVESQDGTIPNRPMAVAMGFNVDPTGLSVERNGVTKTPLMLKRQ